MALPSLRPPAQAPELALAQAVKVVYYHSYRMMAARPKRPGTTGTALAQAQAQARALAQLLALALALAQAPAL